jgi:hypothetical protein
MIQPTDWGSRSEPDVVALNVDSKTGALYRLVWHTSLASAMRPPVLKHQRAVWTTGSGHRIAVANVTPALGKEGYWLERKDHPLTRWPMTAMPTLPPRSARVRGVTLRPVPLVSPGQLIQGLFDARIATASSLSALVLQLLGKPGENALHAPSALVEFTGDPGRRQARLTAEGWARWSDWTTADVIRQVEKRNALVEAVSDGAISPWDAIADIVDNVAEVQPLARAVADQIDALCARWRGLKREDAMLSQAKQVHRPPVLIGLPRGIDPESQLPADHPLREWRQRMEVELGTADTEWHQSDEAARSVQRATWLAEHESEIRANGGGPEFLTAMDPVSGRFSAIRYWLMGGA